MHDYIPALTNPVERADTHENEVQGRTSQKTETRYRGIHDWIQKDNPPSPSIYSTRGSRRSSTWGSSPIPQDEIDKLPGLLALPTTAYETPKGKKVENCVHVRTAWKGYTKAEETPKLMNMNKIGNIGDENDGMRHVNRNTAFYDFYDDIMADD